jgi:HAD superfamily hydrolase (TIGR01509 family)
MKAFLLLDMGGVVLRVGSTEGLPQNRLDWRGREALLQTVRRAGGRLAADDLDRLLFDPWRAEHARRYDVGRDAAWEPHLERLRQAAGADVDIWELLGEWFRPYGDRLVPEEGAAEALERLGAMGKRLAIVSNTPLPGRFYQRILESFDLLRHFETLYFSYDLGSRKPSPLMLRRALESLGAAPGEALMVGDRRAADVAAGRAAGVETVWIRSDFDDGPEPDHEIDALADLPRLLEQLD